MSVLKRYLCLRCSEVSEVDPDNPPTGGCPKCHANGVPANLTDDTVSIDVTWHELRVLVMWAERWACVERTDKAATYGMQRAVSGIADRIHRQHLAKPALTFTGEIAELASEFGKVEVQGINLLPPDLPNADA